MKLKSAAAAVASAVAMLASTAAHAVVYNIGTLPIAPSAYTNFATVSGSSFFDQYNFMFPTGQGLASAAAVSLTAGDLYNIQGLTVSLYTSGGTLVASGTQAGNSVTLTNVVLTPGASYRYDMTGTVTGSLGGQYTFMAQAVPEPETYALFLAGLAAIGFMARRRGQMVPQPA
ncbi:MAG: hypothetical protein RI988_112 [Pseudomonadota bacterium]|jgi:hypothetical protein